MEIARGATAIYLGISKRREFPLRGPRLILIQPVGPASIGIGIGGERRRHLGTAEGISPSR